MTRRTELPKHKPQKRNEYRVRFKVSKMTTQIFGDEVLTAHPGIIKNNLPAARELLDAFEGVREAWIEVRLTGTEDWKKL
jgi:hypothetical protein